MLGAGATTGARACHGSVVRGGTNSLSGCIPTEWESLDILADDLDTLDLEFCIAS